MAESPSGGIRTELGGVQGAPELVVRARNIVKSFGATRAVRDVSFDIPAGAIVGLVGENGAGKSTLARVIAGVYAPDAGVLEIAGEVRQWDPHEGLKAGVSLMAQEIALVPDATVEENVLLGALPRRGPLLDRRAMRQRYRELAELTQFDLDPDVRVSRLRIADQQKVEIMRALSQDALLVVMDEPAAALTADEVDRLHHSIREMSLRGTAVLLISHFLEEVLELTSYVGIMRDGELVRQGPTSAETVETLVAGMVGRALSTDYEEAKEQATGPVRLSVRGLTRPGVLKDVSFDVRSGEILGLAGLIGAGRSEIARCIYGADERAAGEVFVDGAPANTSHPADAIAAGIFMIPESRKEQGLVAGASITDNLTLASLRKYSRSGLLDRAGMRARAGSSPPRSTSGSSRSTSMSPRSPGVTNRSSCSAAPATWHPRCSSSTSRHAGLTSPRSARSTRGSLRSQRRGWRSCSSRARSKRSSVSAAVSSSSTVERCTPSSRPRTDRRT